MVKFTVDMFRKIEMDVNEFIVQNNIARDINVKQSLLEIVTRFHNDPKLMIGVNSEHDLELKTFMMMKKHVISKLGDHDLNKFKSDVDLCKVFILDSVNATANSDWNTTFTFDEEMRTKSMNLECVVIKSKNMISGPHIHLQSKQMSKPNIMNIDNYNTTLVLTRMIKCEDDIYCHYQPIKKPLLDNNLEQVFSKLDFNILDNNMRKIQFKKYLKDVELEIDESNSNIIRILSHFEELKEIRIGSSMTLYDAEQVQQTAIVKSVDSQRKIVEVIFNCDRSIDKLKNMNNIIFDNHSFHMYFTYN